MSPIVDGKTAHSRACPWDGNNAIKRLLAVNTAIETLFPEDSEMGPDTNTISLNMISGGSAVNQVPKSAELTLDTRYYSARRNETDPLCDGSYMSRTMAQILTTLAEGSPANFDLSGKYLAPFCEAGAAGNRHYSRWFPHTR